MYVTHSLFEPQDSDSSSTEIQNRNLEITISELAAAGFVNNFWGNIADQNEYNSVFVEKHGEKLSEGVI